jgi:hypothetical protein
MPLARCNAVTCEEKSQVVSCGSEFDLDRYFDLCYQGSTHSEYFSFPGTGFFRAGRGFFALASGWQHEGEPVKIIEARGLRSAEREGARPA